MLGRVRQEHLEREPRLRYVGGRAGAIGGREVVSGSTPAHPVDELDHLAELGGEESHLVGRELETGESRHTEDFVCRESHNAQAAS